MTPSDLPSPPFPDPLSPMVQLLVQQALDALERGETDVAGAILHAAVHGWAEGHIEGEDGCDGCGYRGDDPEAAGRLRRYRG